jgi:hypothetical protein
MASRQLTVVLFHTLSNARPVLAWLAHLLARVVPDVHGNGQSHRAKEATMNHQR